jgi:hypothetical protein
VHNVDRDEHIQYFDLHREAVRFLLVAEAAKTTVRSSNTTRSFDRNRIRVASVQFCILRRLVASLFLFGLCKVQHEAEYQSLIANHGMALQLLKDRDKQDNLCPHSVGQI